MVAVNAPMRVLALSKRQYMGRDLLDERYGRFRELPKGLARLGNQVRGLCLSYRPRAEGVVHDTDGIARVEWTALSLRRLLPGSSSGYWQAVDAMRESFRPDVVWAGSDVLQLELGVRVARRLGSALVADLYDNFESYPVAHVPGHNALLRRAIRAADGVACISAPLARHVAEDYDYMGPIAVIENAVPQGMFVQQDRAASRAVFGLPADARIVGTAGALTPTRGIGALVVAFEKMAVRDPTLHLVLAGPRDPRLVLPAHPRLHLAGSLPPERVPLLLGALDVSVICNRDSAFGRYCFPQKLYESLGCRVPVVVAEVGAMADLLEPWPRNRFRPNDPGSLETALLAQLEEPVVPDLPIPTWDSLATRLDRLLRQAVANFG
jgi:teichuronic acid biosynthesis glycosyltransferase TuaC